MKNDLKIYENKYEKYFGMISFTFNKNFKIEKYDDNLFDILFNSIESLIKLRNKINEFLKYKKII